MGTFVEGVCVSLGNPEPKSVAGLGTCVLKKAEKKLGSGDSRCVDEEVSFYSVRVTPKVPGVAIDYPVLCEAHAALPGGLNSPTLDLARSGRERGFHYGRIGARFSSQEAFFIMEIVGGGLPEDSLLGSLQGKTLLNGVLFHLK